MAHPFALILPPYPHFLLVTLVTGVKRAGKALRHRTSAVTTKANALVTQLVTLVTGAYVPPSGSQSRSVSVSLAFIVGLREGVAG